MPAEFKERHSSLRLLCSVIVDLRLAAEFGKMHFLASWRRQLVRTGPASGQETAGLVILEPTVRSSDDHFNRA
jgi:hypothetical protein